MIDRAWYFASPWTRVPMPEPERLAWTARALADAAVRHGLTVAARPEAAEPGVVWSPAIYFATKVLAGQMPDDWGEVMRHCKGAAERFGGMLWLRSEWSPASRGMAVERAWFTARKLPVVEV